MMRYYNANQASRELGIPRPEISRLLREGKLKTHGDKTPYRIPETEIKRLARELEREEEELFGKTLEEDLNDPFSEVTTYISALQASKRAGVKYPDLIGLIKDGKIPATKGEGKRASYRIPEAEVENIPEIVAKERSKKDEKKAASQKSRRRAQLEKTPREKSQKQAKTYRVKDVVREFGIPRSVVFRLIKEGKISAMQGGGKGNPYHIGKEELPKIQQIAAERTAQEISPEEASKNQDLLEIQKNLSQAMNRIAVTQEQLATVLAEQMKRDG